ncbi:D-alanyl-lipoteichoic acid biosynthesis protein DltD [Pseudanabaena mucicola]|uniref:D-alanyl-lipoteichoic acid biosynthesis protein DltD n=1 Tax=Pseudanabaena mucicola TaxID=71190 RepID=UPI0025767540|nr:D-alanyl-lipoteichoic acid biosynthesis protein DltD [Pseudanabaena mucicola]MCA6597012.1 DUF1574 family protein [Pseudanabaena sp. M046S1SP1A06QC]
MEITSLDANPKSTDSSLNLPSVNTSFAISRLSKIADQTPASDVDLGRQAEAAIALPENLAGLKFSHTKQKGDCLYIYSQDPDVRCAAQILEAIAPSTQDLDSSVLFAEGIRRLKLHGKVWALGVDLPISPSAIMSAEVITDLLTSFQSDSKLAPTKLKLLLQNNCFNLLCETRTSLLQAEVALPMLNTLRHVRASEYFQSVTVSSRIIGQRKPSWSFEIDLLAISTANSHPEVPENLVTESPEFIAGQGEENLEIIHWPRLFSYLGDRLMAMGRLIGQASPQIPSLSVCVASLAIGLGVTVAIDRTLYHYSQTQEQTKLVIADSKINLQENSSDKGITSKPALNFNIALFNEKLALLDWQITNKKRSPDVLVVGSSRALRGIEPNILEKELVNKGYKDISVFNLGLDGATAKVVNLQVTQILSRPQLPRMIIWADGLRAFNSNRSDITYDEITASTGYKQLQENLKNNEINPETQSSNIATKPENHLNQVFNGIFAAIANRQEVRTSVVKGFDRNTHMLSNSEDLIAATMPSTATALDAKGFVAFDVTFDPKTYFQKFPKVPGDYDIDYRNFETTGSQFDAFTNVVDFCRRNNIKLLVVNMPLHSTYLDAIRTRYEVTFNNRMQELALSEDFTYLDISQSIQNQAELFSDPSHLNQKGAIVITQMLAKHPKIRWQSLKKS